MSRHEPYAGRHSSALRCAPTSVAKYSADLVPDLVAARGRDEQISELAIVGRNELIDIEVGVDA
jgi:hypothetical protein